MNSSQRGRGPIDADRIGSEPRHAYRQRADNILRISILSCLVHVLGVPLTPGLGRLMLLIVFRGRLTIVSSVDAGLDGYTGPG